MHRASFKKWALTQSISISPFNSESVMKAKHSSQMENVCCAHRELIYCQLLILPKSVKHALIMPYALEATKWPLRVGFGAQGITHSISYLVFVHKDACRLNKGQTTTQRENAPLGTLESCVVHAKQGTLGLSSLSVHHVLLKPPTSLF